MGKDNYFEKPDYEDCHKKLWIVTKYSLIFTHFHAVYELVCVTHPKSVAEVGKVALKRMGPTTASLMLASTVQCTVANLRGKKDDAWNYVAGGAAMGCFWGMKVGCSGRGAAFMASFGILGALIKFMADEGIQFLPKFPDHSQNYGGNFGGRFGLDWTLGLQSEDPGRRPM